MGDFLAILPIYGEGDCAEGVVEGAISPRSAWRIAPSVSRFAPATSPQARRIT